MSSNLATPTNHFKNLIQKLRQLNTAETVSSHKLCVFQLLFMRSTSSLKPACKRVTLRTSSPEKVGADACWKSGGPRTDTARHLVLGPINPLEAPL